MFAQLKSTRVNCPAVEVDIKDGKINGLRPDRASSEIKDTNWDAYQMNYGILILHYGADKKVNKIQFSTLGAENIKLCE